MSCYNKCGYDEVTRERVSELEARERLYVQTVNGVYGPFITLDFPDVTSFTELVEEVNNMSFVKEVMSYTATPTTFKARVKMRDDTVIEMVLPPVSETDIGVMTPSAYAQIWTNKEQIEQMLLGTSIPTGDLETATPTQLQLTTLWTTTMERDPADGDRVMNTFDNVVWLFASGLWHAISESSTPMATNETLGTVMGSTSKGKSQVELDGTLSVNGWDATQDNIASKVPKTDIVTTISATPSDTKVPSEKASKDALDLKKDKVTATQTDIMAYCVEIDGTNTLRPYQTPLEIPFTLPVFENVYGNMGQTITTLLTIVNPFLPSQGKIFLQKLVTQFTLINAGTDIPLKPVAGGLAFAYYHYTGPLTSCEVRYFGETSDGWYTESTVGTLSNGVISFTPKAHSTLPTKITVAMVSF